MRIYCAHSSGFDYHTEFYNLIKASPVFANHEFILPHAHGAEPVHSKTAIAEADFVLAEVSFPSTGLGIELGWAEAANTPIWAIHKADKSISTSIKLIAKEVIPYQSLDDVLKRL